MSPPGTVSEIGDLNGDFLSKIANFCRPAYIINVPLSGSPWNWATSDSLKKLEWWSYQAKGKVWRYFLRTWIQYTNVMDGQTPAGSKDRAYA